MSRSATGATIERNLRTGRPLWADSRGLDVATHRLREPVDVDVAIVGAGISGAFMAHDLAPDFRIAVFDRRGPILGSTRASTAMLQWELDLPLGPLSAQVGVARARRAYRRSHAAVQDLMTIVHEARIPCDLRPKSSLYLAGDTYGARALKTEAARRTSAGLTSDYLGPGDLRSAFGIERTGAILAPGSASADPARLAAGLLRRAIASGARLFAPVEVTGLLQGGDHVVLVTDAGVEVRARQVVFCCGYEFPVGVPTHGARVVSTWALASEPVRDLPSWLADTLCWEASDPYLYLRATGDGRLVVGGEDETSPTRHADPTALRSKAAVIVRKLKRLLPGLAIEVDYAWAGAFGESLTSLPLIGAVPEMPHAYAVMGFGGNGITFSVLASQIVGGALRGRPDPEAADYAFA